MAPKVAKVAGKVSSVPKLQSINKEKLKKSSTKLAQSKSASHLRNECLRIMCPICFENISKDSVSSTKCGHVFCTTCLLKALKQVARCPLCQTKMSCTRGPRGYHPLYLETYSSDAEMNETVNEKNSDDVIVLG